ncbi:XRE family transcriptional regulator, partial [Enterococcus faecalis]|nr:XRE family transcriptional regulator [Enterococcus faecalis]HES0121439.1 XRE family transcriptional regulator [Streptococcus pyogenes]
GYVYAVNLLSFTATTPFNLAVYWSAFAALIVIGIAKIILTHLDKETWGGIATKCSLGLTALAICFLAAAREPYITALMFLLFVAKIVVWIKQNGTK